MSAPDNNRASDDEILDRCDRYHYLVSRIRNPQKRATATVGLYLAARDFDPSKSRQPNFEAFARWRIRRTIIDDWRRHSGARRVTGPDGKRYYRFDEVPDDRFDDQEDPSQYRALERLERSIAVQQTVKRHLRDEQEAALIRGVHYFDEAVGSVAETLGMSRRTAYRKLHDLYGRLWLDEDLRDLWEEF